MAFNPPSHPPSFFGPSFHCFSPAPFWHPCGIFHWASLHGSIRAVSSLNNSFQVSLLFWQIVFVFLLHHHLLLLLLLLLLIAAILSEFQFDSFCCWPGFNRLGRFSGRPLGGVAAPVPPAGLHLTIFWRVFLVVFVRNCDGVRWDPERFPLGVSERFSLPIN